MNYRDMGKTQLLKECEEQGITTSTIDTKIKLIEMLEKANGIVHEEAEEVERVHPVFGKYIKCRIHPQVNFDRNNTIYVGINQYSWNIRPRAEVLIPEGVAKSLKEATYAVHVWDPTAKGSSENDKGGHVTEHQPKFVVEYL